MGISVRKRDNSRMAPDAMRPPRFSASELMSAAIRFAADAKRPPRCSASESHECGKSLLSPTCMSCLVTRLHPLIAHMSHEVHGHRPAFPKRVISTKKHGKHGVLGDVRDHSQSTVPQLHWTKSIADCTCGTCMRPSDKTRKLNKDRFDVLSIP